MKEILTAMGIENLELDGFEADDIIGTVARIGEESGLEPLIITGDKDCFAACHRRDKGFDYKERNFRIRPLRQGQDD